MDKENTLAGVLVEFNRNSTEITKRLYTCYEELKKNQAADRENLQKELNKIREHIHDDLGELNEKITDIQVSLAVIDNKASNRHMIISALSASIPGLAALGIWLLSN